MRCERIALPTEPYPHGRFTNSIIINTQKKCKHNYINRFTNFNCYGKIFFTWRHGSAGRAFASHARGHRFESCCLHQQPDCRVVFLYNGLEWRLHRLCAMFAQPVTKVTLHAIDLRQQSLLTSPVVSTNAKLKRTYFI